MNKFKLFLIVMCLWSLLLNIWGCSEAITPTINKSLPEGITIIKTETGFRIETVNRPRARYVLDGEELQRWCPGEGYYYHITKGGMLQIDTDHDWNYDYSTYLK